jgi:hypothetical protein
MAALSGSEAKAPGFAGGWLLMSGLRQRSCDMLEEERDIVRIQEHIDASASLGNPLRLLLWE